MKQFALIAGLLALPFMSHAQLFETASDYTITHDSGPMGIGTNPSASHNLTTNGSTPGVFSAAISNGMLNFHMKRPQDGLAEAYVLNVDLMTGDFPVEISAFSLKSNLKLVNGGGSATTPIMHVGSQASIEEYVDSNGDGRWTYPESKFNTNQNAAFAPDFLLGNGYQIYDDSQSLSTRYILAAQTTYVVSLLAYIEGGAELDPTDASVTVTEEFPDKLFRGYSLSFDYQAVPEPGTWAAMGLGALAVLRRRNKS